MSTEKNSGRKKNKRQHAVALHYGEHDRAPKIVASGAGEIAKRILDLAEKHNVPVREDEKLVDVLAKLKVGVEIPPETYRAVAEILAFLYRTDASWKKRAQVKKQIASKQKPVLTTKSDKPAE